MSSRFVAWSVCVANVDRMQQAQLKGDAWRPSHNQGGSQSRKTGSLGVCARSDRDVRGRCVPLVIKPVVPVVC